MMSFIEALRQRALNGYMPVIADIKSKSPKEGELIGSRDCRELAETLVSAGAPALSVVTESEHFGGSLNMLERICASVDVPVLRKDFIQTEMQIRETASAGASAVLLIVAILDQVRLRRLYDAALRYDLIALVETHSLAEIHMANAISPELVGINNRDILSFEKDDGEVSTTERLIRAVQGNSCIVSESSIRTASDVARAGKAGADAVLVGTALLTAPDISEKYRELSIPLTEV
jgi:indole-3-glycerol phosphate synthase